MRIALRLRRGGARRWHRLLAGALAARGHTVIIDWQDGGDGDSPVLAALRRLEAMLYGVSQEGAGTALGAAAFAAYPESGAAELCFDLTGAPGGGNTPALVPFFGDSLDQAGLFAPLLRRQPPRIGFRLGADGPVVIEGHAALERPQALGAGLDAACARLASMAPAAVERVPHGSASPPFPAAPAHPSAPALVGYAGARLVERLLHRLARPRAPVWSVGWRALGTAPGIAETASLSGPAFSWLPPDPARFVADPFPVVENGRAYVFVEEMALSDWRGFLSVFEIGPDGSAGPLRPVLHRPYHLSYPNVFRAEGGLWMVPETSANGRIELYRPDPFPDRWVLESVLVDDITAADATLFRHGGLWWMAASVAGDGASSWDALHLFFAEGLRGPWRAHRLNPVVVDAGGARPAGPLAMTAGGLIRPAQDCASHYGAGLVLNRIDRLDSEGFSETRLARLAPSPEWRARGFHHLARDGGLEVVDALF